MERIIDSAHEITQDSQDLFQRIRQGREDGKYWRPIRIVPVLSGTRATIGLDEEQYNCSTYYTLPIRNDLLPDQIENKLAQYAKRMRMRQPRENIPLSASLDNSSTIYVTERAQHASARPS